MKKICFCFQMHIPTRLKRYRFFEIGEDHYYYDDLQTEEQVSTLVQESYMPLCQTLLEMTRLSKGKFRCGLAITGATLDLFEQYTPEIIDTLRQLADTGCIEMVGMPYSYSMAAQYNEKEFAQQLKKHAQKVKELFGLTSTTLWNTELMYSDEQSEVAWRLGYQTMMTEDAKQILSWQSPNYVYRSAVVSKLKVLVRNSEISDAISFHFSDSSWKDYPFDAEKFIRQILALPAEEELVNLWMGAEAFGCWQKGETGIFDFLKAIPYFAMEQGVRFVTPNEAGRIPAANIVSVPYTTTWAGDNKEISIFTGNDLQQEALNKLYAVVDRVHLCKDKHLKEDWLQLQDINHFRYMQHAQEITPYESPYDAFINYMNILSDFLQLVEEQYPSTIENEELNSLLTTISNQEAEIAKLQKELEQLRKKKK